MLNPFYIIIILVILFTFFHLLYKFVLYPFFIKKRIKSNIIKEAVANNTTAIIINQHIDNCDFQIKINDKIFLIKIIYNKKNCDLQINNFETFFMYQKTFSNALKAKQIFGLKTFMKSTKQNRILVLAKKAKTIKKVIIKKKVKIIILLIQMELSIFKEVILLHNHV